MSLSGTVSGAARTTAYKMPNGVAATAFIEGSFTAALEVSFDGGSTWVGLPKNTDGDLASYSVTSDGVLLRVEPFGRADVLISWIVSSFSSAGTFRFEP